VERVKKSVHCFRIRFLTFVMDFFGVFYFYVNWLVTICVFSDSFFDDASLSDFVLPIISNNSFLY